MKTKGHRKTVKNNAVFYTVCRKNDNRCKKSLIFTPNIPRPSIDIAEAAQVQAPPLYTTKAGIHLRDRYLPCFLNDVTIIMTLQIYELS